MKYKYGKVFFAELHHLIMPFKIKIYDDDIKTMEDLLQYIKFELEQSIDWTWLNWSAIMSNDKGYPKCSYKNLPKNKTNDII